MGFRRVSEAEMSGKGNLGRPDTPGVSATEMQRIMDELPREVLAPAMNELAEQLEAPEAAAQLGAAVPGEGALPEDTPGSVQGVLEALLALQQAHEADTGNPHGVTAAQAGAYTKAETDAAIAQKVVEIGSADMTRAVYDPGGRATDIFAVTDALAGQLTAQAAALAAEVQVFAATLLADGWVEEPQTPEGGEEGGGESGSETEPAAEGDGTDTTGEGEEPPAAPALAVYTQTVPCAGLLAAYDLEAPQVESTGEYAADLARKEALDALCEAGNSGETLDGQLKWTCYGSHPTADLPLRLRRVVLPQAPAGGGEPGGEEGTEEVPENG